MTETGRKSNLKNLKINRFEGIYAICEDPDQKLFAIETTEMPKGAVIGDVLSVDDETGTLKIDAEASLQAKRKK